VGLIGAGWVSYHHLSAWRRQNGATVVAICDPNEESARRRASEFGIALTYRDADEMLRHEALDAVDIASPRQTHTALVKLAASHGLAILCQKPLAPTLAEAKALVAELPPAIRLMVHENWRFRLYYRQIKKWLVEGCIGAPRQCLMSLFSSGMLPDENGKRPMLERQPFMRTLEHMLVMEVLIHHLDTLRFLLGPLEVLDARLGRITPELIGEDMASITLRSQGEARVMLVANAAAAGYQPALVDRLTIIGEMGSIFLDGGSLKLAGKDTRTIDYDLAEAYQTSYDHAIGHFVDCLMSGAPFETRPSDNLETLRLVETIYDKGALR
jgi:D-apiose dehydrogenase